MNEIIKKKTRSKNNKLLIFVKENKFLKEPPQDVNNIHYTHTHDDVNEKPLFLCFKTIN
jgi:hypothetical protein